jgi:murein L,D-transpeptidase YafK
VNAGGKSRSGPLVLGLFLIVAAGVIALIRTFPVQSDVNKLPKEIRIDRIVVEKSVRKLSVFRQGKEIKAYRIALGAEPIGAKKQEGDMKTPEGEYVIDYRNPRSDYHLALHISYPKPEDVERAAARGVSAGGDIMIHGLPNGWGWLGNVHPKRDWTAGCIALTNGEIEELWRITPDGTPIEIRP